MRWRAASCGREHDPEKRAAVFRTYHARRKSSKGAPMKVDGKHFRSIWRERDGWSVGAIDQRRLPHEFIVAKLATCEDAALAIRDMLVRGAPLIGATAAYGMALA